MPGDAGKAADTALTNAFTTTICPPPLTFLATRGLGTGATTADQHHPNAVVSLINFKGSKFEDTLEAMKEEGE